MLKRFGRLVLAFTSFLVLASSLTFAQDSDPSSTITVTTLADDGAGSLRQAISAAKSGYAINFSLSGAIDLESTLMISGKTISIDGTGQNITISGSHKVTVFGVEAGATLTLNALTIVNGDTTYGDGGGVHNSGILNVSNTTFANNFGHDNGSGGAIVNTPGSTANVSNSTFSGNSAGQAGAIFNAEGTLNVSNSTFSGNFTTTSDGGGGGIVNSGGTTNVSSSTFSGNASQVPGSSLYNSMGVGGTMNVKNTIITNSSSDSCNDVLTESIDNFIDDVSCGGTLGKVTHLSATLATTTKDGTTQTFGFLSDSNAVDAAEDCTDFNGEAIVTDQNGTDRPQGEACDIGAFELTVSQ